MKSGVVSRENLCKGDGIPSCDEAFAADAFFQRRISLQNRERQSAEHRGDFGREAFADAAGIWDICGLIAALGALLTVGCTGMIYASLKTIRQWHNGFVVPLFGIFALASGALWLTVLLQLFGLAAGGSQIFTLVALALAWGLKLAYWRSIDHGQSPNSPESATGLGTLGRVRVLDPPHSGENYLTRELGFRIARKHAAKLRRIAVVMGFLLAALMTMIGFAFGGPMAVVPAILAAVCGSLGIVLERWLFFAEATHTVMLYYGSRTA